MKDPEPGSRAWFEAYLAAFNAGDAASFGSFYDPDLIFEGQAASLSGREAVLDFYRLVHSRIDETVELLTFVGSASHCAAELATTLEPLEDWPDFPTGPLKTGEQRRSVNFAFYDLREGRFARIRSARYWREEPGS
ncbi:hypothetical protein FHS61_000008 [Altererythrobacter atlanticus]|uniref:SnoaL-like domain protein n=1 Tax=Croceibacterium atlanticum TaxID=1267766 RepID=A0A0F7KRK6_9SPHN|nr:nuclear transport factor 2 family protein [Croceibacterium atlanticum]AKH42239.1 SnoaL-like domain protein [Croceibacterium atlanticum]MBB5731015.1 hypothetical protein [Croceibacterium atlanticum]